MLCFISTVHISFEFCKNFYCPRIVGETKMHLDASLKLYFMLLKYERNKFRLHLNRYIYTAHFYCLTDN